MKFLQVTMLDQSKWIVPVDTIARNRANEYKSEYGDDIERSLNEDTLPLFESDPSEIEDWAVNNMDWSNITFHGFAVRIFMPELSSEEYQEGWVNGDKEIIDIPEAGEEA